MDNRVKAHPGPGWDVYELTNGAARVELHPGRGGLVARFELDGAPVLYLDEATLVDRGRNVRGGVPVLFPFAGRPPPGSPLPQHGLARTRAWEVLGTHEGASAGVRMGLDVAGYRLELSVELSGRRLALDARVENRTEAPLPLHYGLHPYFFVPDAAKGGARLEVTATRAFDNRSGVEGPLRGFDFAADEWDVHLLDARSERPVLHRPGLAPVTFEWATQAFPVMVTWAVKGKDYVCVEPWTARGGQPATAFLAPGEARRLPFAFSA